jgi:hypothetical protein
VDGAIPYVFRFLMYIAFGLTMETLFAADGIERLVGSPIRRRVPRKYLEGFVSLYMIPLHGLGILFGFEPMHDLLRGLAWPIRYAAYCVVITFAEVAWGFILDKVLGFYPWDYYADSRFRMFRRGYTMWTLVPMWGIIGLLLEVYSDLMISLSPSVVVFFRG